MKAVRWSYVQREACSRPLTHDANGYVEQPAEAATQGKEGAVKRP